MWVGANAHSSNNRYGKVYKTSALGITYQDRVDCDPSSYDLYFEYDQLTKLGEVSEQTIVQCPDSGYWLEYHVYPIGNGSRSWLAYRGLTGDFHDPPIVNIVHSPRMPSHPENHHEWMTFSIGSPYYGNDSFAISWVVDNNVGD